MTSEMLNTKEIDDILQVIRKVYHTIIYVDLGDGSYHCIQTSEQGIKALLEKRDFDIQSLTEYLISSGLVYAEDAREFAEFFDLDKMRQLLDDGKEYLSITYRWAKGGRYRWDMLEVIPSREYNNKHRGIVICVRDINEEHQRELDKEAKLSLKEKQLVGDKTILIVDDSELQRTTLSYFLDRYYKTMELANGQEALDYLRKHSTEISAILLDLNMPVMDGYTFLQEFQKDEILNMIPVLVLTSDSTPEEEAECLKDGATDFVAKPFNPDVLLSRIQRAIALHEKTVMLNILRLDNQTNCYTRDYFMHMAEHVLAKYPDEEFDLVCTHVVNLANINEQYGTNQGEAILRYVAQNHDVSEFERNIFGRLDDATFVQLLPHSVNIHQKLVEQQVEEFHEYEQVKAGLPPFMQKFGIYERVDHNLPVSVMCDRAVMALDKIKNVYKQRVKVYDESLRSRALKSQQILENMEEAITKHQFQVWYQPKHNIRTGKLVGAEALVRWIHPKYGFMSPADFVPIFEENGFVSHMDYYVWEESCAAMERWKKQQLKTVPVSLNISRKDFIYFHGEELLTPLIKKYNLEPKDIHIEITESAYIDNPEMVIKNVNALHKEGFMVELDDFGTGYSSLSMFGHMDIDVVKLDMGFIRQKQNENNDKMMQYIIDMCKNMNLRVLSEGVETEEQRQRLMSMGCDYVQGYYYSKPLPEKEFVDYLKKHS